MAQSMGHIAATVSLDINPFKASNSQLRAMIKSTASAIRAQDNAIKGSERSLAGMSKSYQLMSQQMRNYQAQMANAQKTINDTTVSQSRRINATNQYNRASAEVEKLRAKMSALSKEITLQSSKWTQVSASATKFGNTLSTVGSKMSSLGSSMTRGLTVPIATGLAYAGKQLVDFQDQMNKVKNVIRTSGESASETNSAYKTMTKDARKYSDQYGVSQVKIAQGYEDLVKRGYTSKAAIGVMNSELKASITTGDDFNDVIKVASQTMESFGLATTKAGKPIKSATVMQQRSKKTLNELSYAADATSTDFNSLGVGMSYVGATAHQAGFKMSETAAAMGILSNNGLEADKAGTGLRKVINSLVTPTTTGQKALAKLNLTTKDFLTKSGKVKSMSAIFKTLSSHMKGMSANEKQDIFHALFGTTGRLDPAVQKSIAKFVVFTAAAGPLMSILGKFVSFGGSAAKAFGTLAGGIARATSAAKLGGSGLQILKAGLSKSAYEAGNFGAKAVTAGQAATTAAGGMTALGAGGETAAAGTTAAAASLGSVALYAAGAIAVIGAGVAVWELWGKDAEASAQRTQRWGSDVGAAADQSLRKFQQMSSGIKGALTDMQTASQTTTKQMRQNFDNEFQQMGDDAKKHLQGVEQAEKGMSADVAAAVEKQAKKERKQYVDTLANAKDAQTTADNILKTQPNGKVSDLSDTQRVMLSNSQNQLMNDEMKLWNITGDKRRKALAALNQDVNKMNHAQRASNLADLRSETSQMNSEYTKQANNLKKQLKKGTINQAEYRAGMKANEKAISSYVDKASAQYIRMAKANGQSTDRIKKDMQAAGLSYADGVAEIKRQSADAQRNLKSLAVSTDGLKGKAKKAADDWNKLVFDPKTGKVRTNAQEEVNKAVNSKDEWNKIKLLEKKAKLSTNAKQMIAAALIENGKWNSMSWDEKKVWLKDGFSETIVEALEKSGEWNNLDLQAKEAIVKSKGKAEMADNLVKFGVWNSLSLKQQEALVHASGTKDIMDALDKMGKWNQLTPKQQTAIVNAKGGPELQQLITDYGLWKGMPASAAKQIIADDKASGNLKAANDALQSWRHANPGEPKNALAIDNASGPMRNATGGVNVFANSNPGSPKNAQGYDNASNPMYSARNGVNAFAGSNPGPAKIAKANDQASKVIQGAIDKMNIWKGFGDITHTITTIFKTVGHPHKHAKGTNYHTGGPMIVNDQPGSTFRELVQFPGGMPFIPFGRNVPISAPRGTKVLRASDTAKLFKGLPQYASGNADAVSILSGLKAQPVVSVADSGSTVTTDQVNQLINHTAQMVDRMGQILGLNAAQLTAIKASAFDKTHMYSVMGRDQTFFDAQQL